MRKNARNQKWLWFYVLATLFISAGCQPEHRIKLESMPSGIEFTGDLEGKFRFDAEQKNLMVKGEVSEAQRDALLKLSDDAAYQRAVWSLFEWNQEGETATKGYISVVAEKKIAELMDSVGVDFMKYYEKNKSQVKTLTAETNEEAVQKLLNEEVRIAYISRQLTQEELEQFKAKGFDMSQILVVRDAVCLITNPKNEVTTMKVSQLKDVLSGKITNWKELGGKDMPIKFYTNKESEMLREVITDSLMDGTDFSLQPESLPSYRELWQKIKTEEGALAYTSRRYAYRALHNKKAFRDTTSYKVMGLMADTTDAESIAPYMYFVYKDLYPLNYDIYSVFERYEDLAMGYSAFSTGPEGNPVFRRNGLMPMQVKVYLNY
ncbi:ABC-type phosphate transport system periplasmic component-like protein [Chloroherpeton thalassium ATCC 35110]|uniref:ABC-type phosphate transport system periplasmic component-like protein n=1 Tax=Chloroherpeton thalassium (strain ATCC 35110 / GB-78) TaxID=517418 RepID=B3QVX1_CHLT3|nr:substrate-binding domain-containing protein [Chloroherpeton thalassium]ACF14625.1 ABC-type phosphate transport system periplasmic component-like protein [Chloroherpeton thalassium ATCC 35110]